MLLEDFDDFSTCSKWYLWLKMSM